eukprot:scaffold43907_cov22-Tisochrysis_lutea.AAC.1
MQTHTHTHQLCARCRGASVAAHSGQPAVLLAATQGYLEVGALQKGAHKQYHYTSVLALLILTHNLQASACCLLRRRAALKSALYGREHAHQHCISTLALH